MDRARGDRRQDAGPTASASAPRLVSRFVLIWSVGVGAMTRDQGRGRSRKGVMAFATPRGSPERAFSNDASTTPSLTRGPRIR
jgi:hypothetical protein